MTLNAYIAIPLRAIAVCPLARPCLQTYAVAFFRVWFRIVPVGIFYFCIIIYNKNSALGLMHVAILNNYKIIIILTALGCKCYNNRQITTPKTTKRKSKPKRERENEIT